MNASFPLAAIRHNAITSTVLWTTVIAGCGFLRALAAPGTWSTGADMPMAISTPAACAVDGVLYVVGGHDRSYRQLNTLFAYDPHTDSWSRKTPMPTARRWLAAESVDGIVYAIGGGGWRDPVLKRVEAYDPKSDRWTTRAPMPTGRFTFAACAVAGIIYAIGGGDDSMGALATVEAYDPKADRWTAKRPLPKPGGMLVAAVVENRIYVCRGKEIFIYNPTTDEWTNQAPFSTWRQASMIGTVDGTLLVLGGCSQDYTDTYDLVTAYDPASGSVSNRRSLPRTRAFGAGVTIGSKVYLVGGASQEPIIHPEATFYSVLDVFNPSAGIDPRILAVSPEGSAALRITFQAEVGQRYGVVSSVDAVRGPWKRLSFSTQTNTVLATQGIMEAVAVLPSDSPYRFLRLVETQ